MAPELDMVDDARRATGDEILIAGLFAPRGGAADSGLHSRRYGSSGNGSRGMRIGSLVGFGAGSAAEPRAREHRLVVAVSPTRVYLLRASADGDRLVLAHTFDRRRVAATIHARLNERTLTLEDTWTGERFELEGERSPEAHVTATMHVLSDMHELAS